jgi:hypothetical protein
MVNFTHVKRIASQAVLEVRKLPMRFSLLDAGMRLVWTLPIAALFLFPSVSFGLTCASQSTIDDYINTGSSDTGIANVAWANQITVSSSCTVTSYTASIRVFGSPSGGRLQIFTDSANAPATLVGTCSGAYSPALTTSFQTSGQSNCDAGMNLIAGTVYWIAFSSSHDNVDSNGIYYRIQSNSTATERRATQVAVDGAWTIGTVFEDVAFTLTGNAYSPSTPYTPNTQICVFGFCFYI